MFISLTVLLVVAIYSYKKAKEDESEGLWERSSGGVGTTTEYLPTVQNELLVYPVRTVGLILCVIFGFVFHHILFVPAFKNYMTWRKVIPIYGISVIYLPYFLIFLCILSLITKKRLFDLINIRIGLSVMMFVSLLDLWLPRQVILQSGNIMVDGVYRSSMDYVLYWIWRRVFSIEALQHTVLDIFTLSWFLVYVLGSLIFLLLMGLPLMKMPLGRSKGNI